jgi:hypothetical protein
MDGLTLTFLVYVIVILALLVAGLWFIWRDPYIEIEHDEHRDAGVG